MSESPEGLEVFDGIITHAEEQDIIDFLDKQEWDTTLSRLTQHYGYMYGYKSYKLTPTQSIPSKLSNLIDKIKRRLCRIDYDLEFDPDQCIVNNYQRGQMISKHIDNTNLFGNMIVGLSLGSPADMIFRQAQCKPSDEGKPSVAAVSAGGKSSAEGKPYTITLEPRSLMVLQDDARYKWTHELKPLAGDRRISITYRVTK